MMDVIVPPVILVLILALLITILSRAIKNAPSVKEDLENMRKASKKSKKLEEFSSLMKNKLSNISKGIEKAARDKYKMTKKHQVQEIEKKNIITEDSLKESVLPDNESKINNKISFENEVDDDYYELEEERERYLVKQIESNPKNLTSYQQLGDYYMETNKFEEARESYRYVLRIDPRNKKAQDSMKSLDRVLK